MANQLVTVEVEVKDNGQVVVYNGQEFEVSYQAQRIHNTSSKDGEIITVTICLSSKQVIARR
jgi:hypothetical protein